MLRQGRTADQQLAAVISGFPKVPPLFRRLFPYSKCAAAVMSCPGLGLASSGASGSNLGRVTVLTLGVCPVVDAAVALSAHDGMLVA